MLRSANQPKPMSDRGRIHELERQLQQVQRDNLALASSLEQVQRDTHDKIYKTRTHDTIFAQTTQNTLVHGVLMLPI